MIDMSLSMIYNGCQPAAKKVAVALESLIRSQFPRDNLYIVGFSFVAREYKPNELIEMSQYDNEQWYEYGSWSDACRVSSWLATVASISRSL